LNDPDGKVIALFRGNSAHTVGALLNEATGEFVDG
jgi:hypothetical protein